MTQEEKQLLLKDLSGRLLYGVKFILSGGNANNIYTMKGIDLIATDEGVWDYGVTTKNTEPIEIKYIKPYLRPMSSMTEEECIELRKIRPFDDEVEAWKYIRTPVPLTIANIKHFDFFHSHHLDWRGLIPKGLALEASKDMYKFD